MDCFDPPSTGRQLAAFAVALPVAGATAAGLYVLLAGLRRGNWLLRFIARVWIIGGLYTALGFTSVLIGGPCIHTRRMRFGGYYKDPTTGVDILVTGLALGVICAVTWPFFAKAKGDDLGF